MNRGERFPMASLESRLGCTTAAELARMLCVCPRTVHRYRSHGLNPTQADRVAVAVGYHPAEVWPDWW
jgi:hypothetical protein